MTSLLQSNHYIDGKWHESADTYPVRNPATGEVLAQVAQAGPEDVGAAVAAAKRSFERGDWRRAAPAERATAG